jgi:hypothetical protein
MGGALTRGGASKLNKVIQSPPAHHEDTPKGGGANKQNFQETKTLMLNHSNSKGVIDQDVTLGIGHKDTIANTSRHSAGSSNRFKTQGGNSSGLTSFFRSKNDNGKQGKSNPVKVTKQLMETDLVNIIYVEPGSKPPSTVKELLQ